MTLARFFDRVYAAAGPRLSVKRASLQTALADHVVHITLGAQLSANDAHIAELVTNLCARLYPTLAFDGPQEAVERLALLARQINPDIEMGEAPKRTQIVVGRDDLTMENALYPRADGWVARLSSSPLMLPHGPENPYAAGAAAALCVGEVFRRVLAKRASIDAVSVSLLDFSSDAGADAELRSSSIGEVVYAGIGAVGSAGLWALARHRGLGGTLVLLDPEKVELSNLQRYCICVDADVDEAKVVLGKRLLAGTDIQVRDVQLSLEDFAREEGGIRHSTICVSVDNENGRRAAQCLLPKLVVNGFTSDTGLGTSWHELVDSNCCLCCLYARTGPMPSDTELVAQAFGLPHERAAVLWVTKQVPTADELDMMATHLGATTEIAREWAGRPLRDLYHQVVCGLVGIDVQGKGVVEAVPLAHQSVLAGVLMAAELVKRTDPLTRELSQSASLVSWEDVLGAPPRTWTRPFARVKGCICTDDDYVSVYRAKWEMQT